MTSSAALNHAFDALANEHRRRIVEVLVAGDMATPELSKQFNLSKQAMAKHLSCLEGAGLITRTKRGRQHHLRLVPSALTAITTWVDGIESGWAHNLDRLGTTLAALPATEPTPLRPSTTQLETDEGEPHV